jgi:hypothetical protein
LHRRGRDYAGAGMTIGAGRGTGLVRGAFLCTLVVSVVAIVCAPAAPSADQLKVDFEGGPPLGTAVTDDYLASAFVRFFQNDPAGGFRPYRRSAPGLAHSGTVVADVGGDICFQDTGGRARWSRAGRPAG